MEYVPTKYWHKTDQGKIQCDLCPRNCQLQNGQRGVCYIRGAKDNQVVLYSYGRSSGFCIDPIEKKPLNHFFPGIPVLSFGTAGCNLTCKFCQNWDISKSREMDTLCQDASPEKIVEAAVNSNCHSIAFTYNDPVIFLEYAKDVAELAHKKNISSVAVTAGYIKDKAREDFFSFLDAVNVDLKAFTESFYQKMATASLAPVLETLQYIKQETDVWLEITTLLIPGENDSDKEIHQMCEWIFKNLGPETPLHFTAFTPHWKLKDLPPTSLASVQNARRIARKIGLYYVYTGNVHDPKGQTTYCHKCQEPLIERDWYNLGLWKINEKHQCVRCKALCHGHFSKHPGTWGNRRVPISL